MAIVSQDLVCEELDHHLEAFDEMVRGAWADYRALPSICHVTFGARSRASVVHDFLLSRAAAYADSTPGVCYFKLNLMHGIVIGGRYAIRFKKFDYDNRSRNQPTLQVAEFRSQIELDGIDAAHHLEVGYILDDLDADVVDVRLACPSGYGNAWVVSLSDRGTATVVADLFSPSNDGDTGGEVEPAGIKPRKPEGKVISITTKSR
ncbi:hypothetical protein [Ottowia thiooxydans]|uniref:Uncharacterized protein n=1 Tax=Ottowia thiooxydans TaxID=219182 RepID=A0ABV2Q2B9_9BURK